MDYKEYLSTPLAVGQSQAFKVALYYAIERADMYSRNRLWLAFPQQVNEVMVYEGHQPFMHGPLESIDELCGIHGWEVPEDLEDQ